MDSESSIFQIQRSEIIPPIGEHPAITLLNRELRRLAGFEELKSFKIERMVKTILCVGEAYDLKQEVRACLIGACVLSNDQADILSADVEQNFKSELSDLISNLVDLLQVATLV